LANSIIALGLLYTNLHVIMYFISAGPSTAVL